MNGLLQCTYILVIILCTFTRVSVDGGAIIPPPWSDPTKNPCANMPGGWQLLYWAPLKQCFKIFTVCTTNGKQHQCEPVHNLLIYTDWVSMS